MMRGIKFTLILFSPLIVFLIIVFATKKPIIEYDSLEYTVKNELKKDKYSDIDDITSVELKKIKDVHLKRILTKDDSKLLDKLTEAESFTFYRGNNFDLNKLKKLKKLKKINLINTTVKDFSLLEQFLYLEELSLNNVTLKNNKLSLGKMKKLKVLSLNESKLDDISFLSELTNLESLYLQSNKITDLKPLANLTKLKELNINGNEVTDITPLADLTNLESLYLQSNKVKSLTAINKLTNLKNLNLLKNKVEDVAPLENLESLKTLYLGENKILNYEPLSKLKKIERLSLNKSNKLSDISFLSPLITLKYLDLSENSIVDITALKTLDNLVAIDIRKNSVQDYSTLTYLKKNKKLVEVYSDKINHYRSDNSSYFGGYRNGSGFILIMNNRNRRYRSYNRTGSYGSSKYGKPSGRSYRRTSYGGGYGRGSLRGGSRSFRGRSYGGGGK